MRADINVCIVGDPATGKSEFLRQVFEIWPRASNVNGKSLSAVGLTAAVMKEEGTDNFVIQPGVLVLTDKGVCCIDELDKTSIEQQNALLEAMEQQQVTIVKAGLKTSLPARTSVLAASNPRQGAYDPSKSFDWNIQFSAALTSRFDFFFILRDYRDESRDYEIAKRIVQLHRNQTEEINPTFEQDEVLLYLRYARTKEPVIIDSSAKVINETYVSMRNKNTHGSSRKITLRQLDSLIRASEAIAKLHLSDVVQPHHVDQAIGVMKTEF